MMDELTTVEWIMDNLGLLSGYALAILAGIDKVALVAIKTMDNIRDAWVAAFPGKKDRGPEGPASTPL